MSHTYATVHAIRATGDVDSVPLSLLTIGTANPKTGKGEKRGYRTASLHMSPARLSGFEEGLSHGHPAHEPRTPIGV